MPENTCRRQYLSGLSRTLVEGCRADVLEGKVASAARGGRGFSHNLLEEGASDSQSSEQELSQPHFEYFQPSSGNVESDVVSEDHYPGSYLFHVH